MATTPWFTHRPPPTQFTISTPTMETTHRQHSAHTAIHLTQCHPTTTVPYRQISFASRRSRTAESTDFLPTTLLPWMSHHLEHTTTLSTTTRPHRPTTPTATHSIFPRQHTTSLSMGIPQTFLHTAWRSLPQAKEVLAKRSNSHQLLQIHCRHPFTSHLQGIRHHASPSPTSTSRTTIHTQPMAAPPQPFPKHLRTFTPRLSTMTSLVSSTVYPNNAWSTQSSAYAIAGKPNTQPPPSPSMYNPPAIPFNTHTSADITSTAHNNAHSTLNTFP